MNMEINAKNMSEIAGNASAKLTEDCLKQAMISINTAAHAGCVTVDIDIPKNADAMYIIDELKKREFNVYRMMDGKKIASIKVEW